MYIAFALQTVGLQYTTPSKNAFLTAVNVIIVPIIAFAVYKRRIDGYEIIGSLIAIVGIGFLSLQGSLTMNIGDALSLACAVAFAFDIFVRTFLSKGRCHCSDDYSIYHSIFLGVLVVVSQGDIPTTLEKKQSIQSFI